MQFLEPSALLWGGVLAGVLALYLFRRRPRRMVVSALAFFKTLSIAHQESAWLRFLKRLLAILLSVTLVACAVCWLAKLTLQPAEGEYKTVVLLVDRSASMAVRPQPDAPDRLQEGVRRLRGKLAGLSERVGIAVIAYDARPEIRLGRTLDRHAVEEALSGIAARPVGADEARAVALARELARVDPPAVVWHLTDHEPLAALPSTQSGAAEIRTSRADAPPGGGADSAGASQAEIPVEPVIGPLPRVRNAGITAFHLRRLPLEHDRYEAFVQIEGVAAVTAQEERNAGTVGAALKEEEAELEIRMDGRLTGLRKVPVRNGGRERLVIPLSGAECAMLELTLRFPGDMLAADNAVFAPVPRSAPLHVAWVTPSPDPYTELALQALAVSGIEIAVYKPEQWPPKQRPDLALFEQAVPSAVLPCPAILLNPDRAPANLRLTALPPPGAPVERFRVTDPTHPLLYGVADGRLALTQTAALPADSALEPLWIAPAGALLAAGEQDGQRLVVMGFSPLASERLVLTPSYPLLLGNAMFWATEQARFATEGQHLRTGALLPLREGVFSWTAFLPPAPVAAAAAGGWLALNGVGAWKISDGRFGSASLLDAAETRIVPAESAADKAGGAAAGLPPLPRLLLGVILLVIAGEFWLYHRHAVY